MNEEATELKPGEEPSPKHPEHRLWLLKEIDRLEYMSNSYRKEYRERYGFTRKQKEDNCVIGIVVGFVITLIFIALKFGGK